MECSAILAIGIIAAESEGGTPPCCIFAVVILLIILAAAIGLVIQLSRAEESARQAYAGGLQQLKKDPNNPDLREKALQLGRVYSLKVNNSNRVNEVTIQNDINAACARATVGQFEVGKVEITNSVALGGQSVAEEIEKLKHLFLAGVITAEEFERGKTLFLGAPPDKAGAAIELLQNLDLLRKQGVLSQSEFNMKKWDILSERLIPGKMQAARIQPESSEQPSAPAPLRSAWYCAQPARRELGSPPCPQVRLSPALAAARRYARYEPVQGPA